MVKCMILISIEYHYGGIKTSMGNNSLKHKQIIIQSIEEHNKRDLHEH